MRLTVEFEGYPFDRLVERMKRNHRKRVCRRKGHIWHEPTYAALFSFFGPSGRSCSRCYALDPDDERNGPRTFSFAHSTVSDLKKDITP